jgi:hypothetical protein
MRGFPKQQELGLFVSIISEPLGNTDTYVTNRWHCGKERKKLCDLAEIFFLQNP